MQSLQISNIEVVPCTNSNFVKTSRVKFMQNNRERRWDYVNVHDAVAILLLNTTRNAFVLVRQFRPALYMYINNEQNGKERSEMSEDTGQIPITASPQVGVSYELCAGIVDKKKSLAEIAKEEVLEETGYEVSVESLECIFSARSVGSSGNQVTIYYAEVTDAMKVGQGGGAPGEDEEIDVEYLPVEKAKDLVFDSSKAKPASLVAAFMWYFWKNKLS
eukprot:Seg2626.2 transcript_id=Seg2626.2/GoldUCD/mRNA.D3Y31 product="Uridine diphosphate glucose pyrophosphatase" protein_id=Seg2626.2/GoldUCD/D3Y31